jgi:hyperosmotically inducible periplasmic protein
VFRLVSEKPVSAAATPAEGAERYLVSGINEANTTLMKTLFVFLVGIAVGAYGLYYYEHQAPTSATVARAGNNATASARDTADQAMARGREFAANVSDSVAAKMQEWHLTAPDIRADLAKTGQVVRDNTARARERASDVRIVAVIKAKFVLDRDLSAGAIEVDSLDGNVTLAGTVGSEDLIGRAVADALDTDGVHHVAAKLAVKR